MPMAIATPPQRMWLRGLKEHEPIGVGQAHPAVLRWLANAFEEGKTPARARSSARGLIFASMNFFVTGMPSCSGENCHPMIVRVPRATNQRRQCYAS
jgi:hypothetical protein